MKYIRTEDDILLVHHEDNAWYYVWNIRKKAYLVVSKKHIINQADTIEELCDEFVVKYKDETHDLMQRLKWAEMEEYNASLVGNGGTIYGAIWTDKGLIYVAKMNEKGELELL